MKDCTHCRYAEWKRTKSGKLHPSGDGRCKFPYGLPQLPASMYWIGMPTPSGGWINRREELKQHCPYYAREN